MREKRTSDDLVKTREGDLKAECLVSNTLLYAIGTQDGRFPRMGWHSPGEMGGIWLHPIKLADGFWLEVKSVRSAESRWLYRAVRYTGGPFWSRYDYQGVPGGLTVERMEFVPDSTKGMVIRYLLRREPSSSKSEQPEIIGLRFVVGASNVSVWRGGQTDSAGDQLDGEYRPETEIALVAGRTGGRYMAVAADTPVTACEFSTNANVPDETGEGGCFVQLRSEVEIPIDGGVTVTYLISGSLESDEIAIKTVEDMRDRHESLYEIKELRIGSLMEQTRLEIEDRVVLEGFEYSKLSVDLLERDVEGVGRGVGAGLPEYPWWFGCDSCYLIPGILVSGRYDLAIDTLRLIAEASNRAGRPGRIPHEVVTDGTVVHPGNTQETPHFIATVWDVWRWTGDESVLSSLYPYCQKGFDWLLNEMDTDGDRLPEGYGIAEVDSLDLEMVDTAVHTLRAARALADMANYLGDTETENDAQRVYCRLKDGIDRRFWIPDESIYGDMVAKPSQIMDRLHRLRKAFSTQPPLLLRLDRMEAFCRAASDDSERAWFFGLSLTLVLLAEEAFPEERRFRQLELFESPAFTGEYGINLTGTGVGPAMTISTGLMVMAEFAAGCPEKAIDYIHRMQRTSDLRFPGYPSEFSPDKGCSVQAWSNYGLAYGVIGGLFGVDPHVPRGVLNVSPCIPETWDGASAYGVPVGDCGVNIQVKREGDRVLTVVSRSDAGDLPFTVVCSRKENRSEVWHDSYLEVQK